VEKSEIGKGRGNKKGRKKKEKKVMNWRHSKFVKLIDKEIYQRLMSQLIYLSYIWPDIAYVISVVSRFMQSRKGLEYS